MSVSCTAGTRSVVRPSPPELLAAGGPEHLSLPLGTGASGAYGHASLGGGGGSLMIGGKSTDVCAFLCQLRKLLAYWRGPVSNVPRPLNPYRQL